MQNSPFDWFILSLGVMLFIIQVVWFAGALFSYNRIFNAKLPYCRKFFIDLTEIFPLLGILGTVVALSSTLLGFDASEVDVNSLVRDFAPALSSTISGLICAIINSIMSSVLGLLIEPNYKSDQEGVMSIGRKLVPLLDVMMLLVGLFLLLIAMARFHPTSSKSSTSNLPKTLKKIVGKLPVVPLYNDGVTTRCWLLGENGYGEGEPIETEEQFQMVFKKLYPNISTDSDEHCVILVFPEYWSSALDEKGKEEILQRYKKKNRSLTFAYRFLDKLERKKE